MSERRPSEDFHEERANVWTLLEQIIHNLRHNHPADRALIIGRVGHLSLRLSSYRQAGELMGVSFPPSDIVRHAPPGFFTERAQRHQNYFGTEFGYACWFTQSHLGYATQDLFNYRSPTRIADLLEELSMTWHLIEMRAFPQHPCTAGSISHSQKLPVAPLNSLVPSNSPKTATKPSCLKGPTRSSPRVRFSLPAPSNTLWGPARRRRHRPASPYPGRGHRGRSTRRRPLRPIVEDDFLLPPIINSGNSSPLPTITLPGIQSLFTPCILPSGRTLPSVPKTLAPPPVGLCIQTTFDTPAPSTCISALNSNMGEVLHGVAPLQRLDTSPSSQEPDSANSWISPAE